MVNHDLMVSNISKHLTLKRKTIYVSTCKTNVFLRISLTLSPSNAGAVPPYEPFEPFNIKLMMVQTMILRIRSNSTDNCDPAGP